MSLQGVPYTPPPTLGPFEFLLCNKLLLLLIYFVLSRDKIDPVEGNCPAAVVVSPSYEEQTEEWKGNICTTYKLQ